jgi:hypothetical protein
LRKTMRIFTPFGVFLGLVCLSLYALVTLNSSYQEGCGQTGLCQSISTSLVILGFTSFLAALAVSLMVYQILRELLYLQPLRYKENVRISATSEALQMNLSVEVGDANLASRLQRKLSASGLPHVKISNAYTVSAKVDLQGAVVAAGTYKRTLEKLLY